MKNNKLIALFLFLLLPGWIQADEKKPEGNVNERYTVESIVYSGIEESKISQPLRDEAQKMTGAKYNEKIANGVLKKIQADFGKRKEYYKIDLKVEKGNEPDKVKVVFQFKKRPVLFSLGAGGVYHSKEGNSGTLHATINDRALHSILGLNLLTDSNSLLERYTGIKATYENQKVGTEKLRLNSEFGSYHEKFNAATKEALTLRPEVPGVYRARQNFSPSLTLQPFHENYVVVSAGFDFQRLEFQTPASHTQKAYVAYTNITAGACNTVAKYTGCINAIYNVRTATRVLNSDFVYTRHFLSTTLSFNKKAHDLIATASYGSISGTPPLFERFALGNSCSLRGWNKLDVSPLGGTQFAHGTLEYRYRYFRAFYDVGTEWDGNSYSPVRHGIGFGILNWPFKSMTVSLAFPIRSHSANPVFGVF
jgi:hypothetical protein